MKRMIKISVSALVVICLLALAPVVTVEMGQDRAGQTIAQAAAQKGFVKKGGKWYYYKGGKKVKGLKKISGKYYFFNKKGAMQSGQKKIKGSVYYFNKVKAGKKKGQAPALTNKSKKMSGKIYYFQKNGKRYSLGYKSTGNQKGNDAAGYILSSAKVTASMSQEAAMKKAYRRIVRYGEYVVLKSSESAKLSKKNWQYDAAKIFIQKKGGFCYNFASVTACTAKALGYKPTIVAGTWLRPGATKATEHAWVTIQEGGVTKIIDSQNENNVNEKGTGPLQSFLVTPSGSGSSYQVEGKSGTITYYVKKTY